jgi:alanyl-tRNA synthetase
MDISATLWRKAYSNQIGSNHLSYAKARRERLTMTKKLFWENPYLIRLETHITHVVDNEVTVKETIFYAFSGGQESDQGTIASHQVLQARKDGKEIRYSLQADHSLKIGDVVTFPHTKRLHFLIRNSCCG